MLHNTNTQSKLLSHLCCIWSLGEKRRASLGAPRKRWSTRYSSLCLLGLPLLLWWMVREKGRAMALASSSHIHERWGNYTVIIMCTSIYTLTLHKHSPLHTRWGPRCLQPCASLPSSSIHLCSTIFSPQLSLSAPAREFQPSRKACQFWTGECACVCMSVCLHCVSVHVCTHAHMHIQYPCACININTACLTLGPHHHWQADRCGCCRDAMLQGARSHILGYLSTDMANLS